MSSLKDNITGLHRNGFEIVLIFAISCNSCALSPPLTTKTLFTLEIPTIVKCHHHFWVQTAAKTATKTRDGVCFEAELW